ncbi:hypothetical protein DFH06DRAFT_733371 [Mycena polygramma]|nr:hypothetical protein DFH06DRAFT_733371 [Mycena polygramma]
MAVPLGGTGLSYASSAFLALFLETLFYGLFAFMFIISAFVLCRKRSGSHTSLANINLPLLISASTRIVLWSHLSTTLNVLYSAQTIVGDGFIIFRVYKVWGANKVVYMPFLLCFLASIATAVGTLVTQALRKPSQSLFSGALHDWPLASYIMTLVINVGCTGVSRSYFIGYRFHAVIQRSLHTASGPLAATPRCLR